MNDLEKVLWAAWEKVRPRLEADPDELRARLARRRSKMFLRPLRAYCVAVRATDRRMTPWNAAMVPEDAVDSSCPEHLGRVVEHRVVLDKRLLGELCGAVWIEPPGVPVYEVARRLGCTQGDLMALRRNGTLAVHHLKGFAGRRGKATAMVYTPRPMDPTAFGRMGPDPIWGCLWELHAGLVPEDFAQEVVRVPEYGKLRGEEVLRGWRWVCPGCGRHARTIFYPVKVMDWGEYVGFRPKIGDGEVDGVPEVNGTFACHRCHGVVRFSRASLGKSWNQLVLHFSGGLLYGSEVERPAWLKEGRVREVHKRRRAAPRQEELARWLGETELSEEEIGREMGIKRESVLRVAKDVYRKWGVEGREELKRVRGERAVG